MTAEPKYFRRQAGFTGTSSLTCSGHEVMKKKHREDVNTEKVNACATHHVQCGVPGAWQQDLAMCVLENGSANGR